MKLVAYGNPGKPVILMNNGTYCTERSYSEATRQLEDDFHVIVAVVDGSDGGGEPYISTENQARKTLSALVDAGVTHVALLQGLSMGAEVALEVLRQVEAGEGAGADVQVDRAFFDGGPFLHLNGIMRAIMLKKFRGMAHRMAGKTQEASLEAFRTNKMVAKMIGGSIDGYEPMIRDVWQTAQTISDEQIAGQVATCYTCDLPAFSEERQERMLFQWCEKEKAREAEGRVRKAYASARFRIVDGLGHGGMAALQPHEYAQLLGDLAAGREW